MSGPRLVAAIVAGLVVTALLVGIGITVYRGQDASAPSRPLTETPPGHWPTEERTAFINSCVDKCRAAPGVTPAHYPICDHACTCAADQAEKTLTIDEIAVINGGNATAEQKDKLKRVEEAGLACVTQNKK